MKFGQSTEYKKKNIFLQKSCRNCGSGTSLVSKYFDNLGLGIQQKQTVYKFALLIQKDTQI